MTFLFIFADIKSHVLLSTSDASWWQEHLLPRRRRSRLETPPPTHSQRKTRARSPSLHRGRRRRPLLTLGQTESPARTTPRTRSRRRSLCPHQARSRSRLPPLPRCPPPRSPLQGPPLPLLLAVASSCSVPSTRLRCLLPRPLSSSCSPAACTFGHTRPSSWGRRASTRRSG